MNIVYRDMGAQILQITGDHFLYQITGLWRRLSCFLEISYTSTFTTLFSILLESKVVLCKN